MSNPTSGNADETQTSEPTFGGGRVWPIAVAAGLTALVLQIILRLTIDRLTSTPTQFFSADDTNESRITMVFGISLLFIFPTALFL